MSKRKKPNFPDPPTQQTALRDFRPSSFYAPFGDVIYGTDGLRVNLNPAFQETDSASQAKSIRDQILGSIGIVGDARAQQIEEFGNTFLDESLRLSGPRLKALSFERGRAGSRQEADAFSDLVNKATTSAILNREELKRLDEQLKLQQLTGVDNSLNQIVNRGNSLTGSLLQGSQISNSLLQQAINNAQKRFENVVALESERVARANSGGGLSSFLGPASMAASFIPGIGPALSTGLGVASAFADPSGGGLPFLAMSTPFNPSGSMPSLFGNQGAAIPGLGGYGFGTPYGTYNTGNVSVLPGNLTGGF